ncbi:hypothetical protein LJK87_24645 [Paenibacillus sp. P25]|nr:hypothetical protein LJK87_24645 [Paenibacillus sp. P25]
MATINQDNLIKMLKTLTPYNEGETLLMTGDGGWKLSSDRGANSELDAALEEEFSKHSSKAESFLLDFNKTTYSVSYGKFSRLGTTWIYISAAPLTSVTAPVVQVSKWILIISITALLLALLMSWFVSHRIYSPVERLVRSLSGDKSEELSDEFDLFEKRWNDLSRESETLRSKLSDQPPALREGFFLQLVQGYFLSYQESDIRERMKHYGWHADDRQFVALMFQLTGFSSLEGRFSSGDEDLVTFTAANIIEELTRTQYEQAEVINFHNLSVGLLLSFPSGHPTGWVENDLTRFCEEAIQAINRILKMQVTVSVSKWTYAVKQIPHLFEEARQALVYRDLLDNNQIIKTEHLSGRARSWKATILLRWRKKSFTPSGTDWRRRRWS